MEAGATTAAGGSSGAVTMAPEGATVLSLPEGSSMMIGEDGEQYVTIQQDGQTYAIPLSEYQSMQPGGTITIQVSFSVKTKCVIFEFQVFLSNGYVSSFHELFF